MFAQSSTSDSSFAPYKPRKVRRKKRSSPISKLTYDILWYIFTFLQFHHDDATDISRPKREWHDRSRDHEISLIHMQHISQVCKHWRDLMLETPSFWAQGINLQLLNQKSDHWRNEVMKRTETSPLSVRGNIIKATDPSTEFVLSLIKDNWPRIRVLNLVIDDIRVVNDPIWETLYNPAPTLEICRIAVFPVYFRLEGKPLFSNSAPRLRFLSCDTASLTPSGSMARWSSQLDTLIVSTFDLELPQILQALNFLPFLHTLQIGWKTFRGKGWDVIGQDWPVARPPSLRTLSLKSTYKNAGGFLHQIVLPPTCRLLVTLSAHPSTYVVPKMELELLRSSLAAHFSNIVGPKRLSWTSTFRDLELIADTGSPRSRSTESVFQIAFLFYNDLNFDTLVYTIPFSFSTSGLASDITELVITLSKINHDPSNKDLIAFICSLRSVKSLSTNTESLELLIPILDNAPGSFPKLDTIVLQSDRSYFLKPDVIMRFLMHRRDAGMAISVFDLRECRSPGQEKLLFLEGLDGLSVLWDPVIRERIDEAYRDWASVDSDD